jgi:hypothetical protein
VNNHHRTLSALVCAGLLTACAAAESTGASASGRPTVSATGDPTAESTTRPPTVGAGGGSLDAGTYRFDLTALDGASDPYPAFLVTVPEGWESMDGWVLGRPAAGGDGYTVSVSFWDVDEIYGHPCQWEGSLTQPGGGVDDLAAALVDVPMRSPSDPIEIEIDGRSGSYLEWSVPVDIAFDEDGNFPDCDGDVEGNFDFRSWTGQGWATTRYHQGPGQVDRLWILDVDGERLVIDGSSMPDASDAEIEALVDVVSSVQFVIE